MLEDLIDYSKKLKRIDPIKKHKDFPLLMEMTSFLSENATLRQRLWHVCNNVYEIPLCKHCGKNTVKWRKTKYVDFCSMKCLSNDKDVSLKRKSTLIEKYGVDNPNKSEVIKQKIKNTNLKKYGVPYATQAQEVINKRKNTNLKKYGNVCSLHDEYIKQKIKENNIKKYGYEFPSQSPEFKRRVKETNLKKYGREYFTQTHISEENLSLLNNKEYLKNQHIDNKISVSEIAENLGVTPKTVIQKLKDYGIEQKYYYRSKIENEIVNFIKEHSNFEIIENCRNIISKELDIYIPEINFAIEINGNFYHSELNGKGRNYHNDKFNECKEVNIDLLYILESDWLFSKEIIKSLILTKIGKTQNKINARDCEIRKIDNNAARNFLDKNHLNGYVNSSICIGLFYNNDLVSVMTFTKNRFGKIEEYEISRFASKLYTNVRGAAGKIFKYFLNEYNPKSVVSYSQRGIFTGKIYEKLGFSFSHTSNPNYRYFHNKNPLKLFSRNRFQKHKLSKILEKFDPKISEWENMKNNGFNRIWDCGNNVYKFNNPNYKKTNKL